MYRNTGQLVALRNAILDEDSAAANKIACSIAREIIREDHSFLTQTPSLYAEVLNQAVSEILAEARRQLDQEQKGAA